MFETRQDEGEKPSAEAKPPAITVRAARVEDADALNAMANMPGFRFGTMRLPFRPVSDTRGWLERQGENDTLLVAEVAGVPVGQAGLHRRTGRMAHTAHLGIGVHDDWVGRGVGRVLMAALLDTADNWLNLKRVDLTVYADNDRAMALYRSFGFEVEGTHRAYAFRDGHYVDAIAMARVREG